MHISRLSPSIFCLLGKGHCAIAIVATAIRVVCSCVIVVIVVALAILLLLPQSRAPTAPVTQGLPPWGLVSLGFPSAMTRFFVLALLQSQDPPQSDPSSAVLAWQSIIGNGAIPNIIVVNATAPSTIPPAPSLADCCIVVVLNSWIDVMLSFIPALANLLNWAVDGGEEKDARQQSCWCHCSILAGSGSMGRASKEKDCHPCCCWPHPQTFFSENSQKLTKIKNWRSSRHVESDSMGRDDCQIERSPSKFSALHLKVWWNWWLCQPSCQKVGSYLLLICPVVAKFWASKKCVPAGIKTIRGNKWAGPPTIKDCLNKISAILWRYTWSTLGGGPPIDVTIVWSIFQVNHYTSQKVHWHTMVLMIGFLGNMTTIHGWTTTY